MTHKVMGFFYGALKADLDAIVAISHNWIKRVCDNVKLVVENS